MLASISPLGERARNNRWILTVASFTLASTAGGAAMGAAAGLAGAAVAVVGLNDRDARLVFAAAALLAVAVDAGLVRVRLRPARRQVNEYWLDRYRGWVYGAGFGAQLGAGVVTIVTSAAVYLTVVAAVLTRSWAAGGLVGASFGVARALPVLLTWRVRTGAALRHLHERLARWRGPVAWLTVAAALGAAGAVVGGRV